MPRALPCPAETSLRLYFDELVGRAKDAAHRAEKARAAALADPRQRARPPSRPAVFTAAPLTQAKRRARDDFLHMLKSMRDVKAETTWEEAAGICKDEPEWKDVRAEGVDEPGTGASVPAIHPPPACPETLASVIALHPARCSFVLHPAAPHHPAPSPTDSTKTSPAADRG